MEIQIIEADYTTFDDLELCDVFSFEGWYLMKVSYGDTNNAISLIIKELFTCKNSSVVKKLKSKLIIEE